MYVLFNRTTPQDINLCSIGCSNYIPEFTYGVYFDDLSQLQKIKHEIIATQQTNEQGQLLFVDKNNVISTEYGIPLMKNIQQENIISIENYPQEFTLKDIMICKKQYFINKGYDECYLYEFNLYDFINLDTSKNYDAGINDIKMRKDSVLDLKPVKFNFKHVDIQIHSLYPISVHYSFDNKTFKKSDSFNLKDKELFLKFKNTIDKDNILYDYQLLLRK